MSRLRSHSINRMRWIEYELVESGVKVREKDLNGIREDTIEFDRIGREATYFLSHSAKALFGIAFFLIIAIATGAIRGLGGNADRYAWIVWVAVAAFIYLYYLNTKQEGFRLPSEFGSLVLRGSKGDMDQFICALMQRKQESICTGVKRRLAIMDRPEVERYLLALREGSVLTTEQYETIRAKAGLQDETRPPVGFMPGGKMG